MTLVKGMKINFGSFHHVHLLHHQNGVHRHTNNTSGTAKNLFGALTSLASSISYALWLIIQVSLISDYQQLLINNQCLVLTYFAFQKKMTEKYQSHYTSTVLMSFWDSVVSVVFALCNERDWSQWRLGWNIRLLTVAYGVYMLFT